MTDSDVFPTDTTGLADATGPRAVRLADGDHFDIDIRAVRKVIDGAEVRMLAYNGSIPGPTLHVQQGAQITVRTRNAGDIETTVHWHGLRLENRYDGVPHETQQPIPVGGTYTYQLQFPDAGFYWYHPHLREDFAQDMGLYGTIIVEPADPAYWASVDRQVAMTLDDLLIEDGRLAPFHRSRPTFTAMGRFGNVLLINGETAFSDTATVGEVVRLYLVNTANTRLFNVALRGARMKLVGGDSGRFERETFVDEVLIAPSERVVLDVLFDKPGEVRLEHRTPDRVYDLGTFSVTPGERSTAAGEGTAAAGEGTAARAFEELRVDAELTAERQSIAGDFDREPDKVLAFVARMPLLYGEDTHTASSYVCPMHPEVTDSQPATCPKCGMKLVPVMAAPPASYVCPMHPEVTDSQPATCPKCGMKLVHSDAPHPSAQEVATGHGHHEHGHHEHGHHEHQDHGEHEEHPEHGHHEEHGEHGDGLEWEDLMPEINRASDPTNMIWQLIDRETGAENAAIEWSFTVGDRVKIRLVNEMDSDHPMHHPFHIHGAGRFLVLSRDGEPEPNLVWKDTVLVRAGETVDILLDVSNPGLWMAHCHIAEHAESGMMFSFTVNRKPE